MKVDTTLPLSLSATYVFLNYYSLSALSFCLEKSLSKEQPTFTILQEAA
jgi:hypothetical protein